MKLHYIKSLGAFFLTLCMCSCASQPPAPYVDKSDMVFSKNGQKHKGAHSNNAHSNTHKLAEPTAFDNTSEQISEASLQPLEDTSPVVMAGEKPATHAKVNRDSFNKEPSYKKDEEDGGKVTPNDVNKLTDIDLERQVDKASPAKTSEAPIAMQPQVPASTGPSYKLKSPLDSTKFDWPVEGKVLSHYGKLGNKFNEGINISAPLGSPVAAASDGKVVYIGNNVEGYGNLLIIRHDSDIMSAYAHLKEIVVERGATVKRGESIGSVGQVGNVSQPQLHFSIRKGKKTIDPELPLSS